MNKEDVWKMMDLLRRPGASGLSQELLNEALKIVQTHKVEVYEMPSKAPGFYGHPGASPKQLKIQGAFENASTHRIFAGSGANQSGKTEAVGGLCFCKHLRDHAKPGDIYWVISQSTLTMRDVPHRTLWKFIPHDRFPEGLEYSPKLGFGQIPTLELWDSTRSGKIEVWFKTEEMDIKAFESSRVSGIWWTECTKEAIWYAVQPRVLKYEGFILMDYVPTEGWHQEIIQEPAKLGDPFVYHIRFAMMDNAHNLPEGAIEYARSQLSPEEAAVRIDGKDGAAFGAVYKTFDPERHIVEPFRVPPDCPRWRALDYGYRNPTACVWVAALPPGFDMPGRGVLPTGGIVVYREYYQKERVVKDNVKFIRELSENEVYRGPVIIDPTTTQITQANGKSIAQEFRDAGLAVRPGIRVNQYGELAMVENVRRMFDADQLFFTKDCPKTAYEHRVWKVKERSDGSVASNEPFEDKNNHTCDALKLVIAERPIYGETQQGKILQDPNVI
jgi:hypothetical protein